MQIIPIALRALHPRRLAIGLMSVLAGGVSAYATNNLPASASSNLYMNGGSGTPYYLTSQKIASTSMTVYVGSNTSSGNVLSITNSGQFETYTANVGQSSSNNVVTVSGAGSYWKGTRFFTIGANVGSTTNSMSVENGATISVGLRLVVGQAGASNNSLTISGAGSSLTVADTLQIAQGTTSAATNYNTLAIVNGATATTSNTSTTTLCVGMTNSSNNLLLVSGNGSIMAVTGTVVSGAITGATTNSVRVLSGGKLIAANLIISSVSGASNNTVEVSGTGSLMTITSAVTVGNGVSSGNVLSVTDAAALTAASMTVKAGGTMSLSGVSSVVTLSGNLAVSGVTATAATLSIQNGGLLHVGGAMSLGTNASLILQASETAAAISASSLSFDTGTGISGTQKVTLNLSDIDAAGTYILITTTGGITGFDVWYASKDTNLTVLGLDSGLSLEGLSVVGDNLVATVTAIPEPAAASAVLALLSLSVCWRARRRA